MVGLRLPNHWYAPLRSLNDPEWSRFQLDFYAARQPHNLRSSARDPLAGIGNRTSIADGNTWNHEHIALLGRALVSSEKNGHAIARHLADYVLVWTTR